ncbi:MAG: hypothetical protein M1820_009737 [Bogoriella megaspora]|nr:MAG: hypothetical protein M1820_009737 [Bogoriella megaspora]
MASSTLQNLQQLLSSFNTSDLNTLSENARLKLIEESRAFTRSLQKPEEIIYGTVASAMTQSVALRISIDLQIFTHLSHQSPLTTSTLASLTSASPQLILRLMRPLIAGGFILEPSPATYSANTLTHTLSKPQVAAGIQHWFDRGMIPVAKMPEYFQRSGYTLPQDEVSGPQQFGFGTQLESYAFWATKEGWLESFNTYMTGAITAERTHWTEWFPVEERVVEGFRSEEGEGVLYVDVGGGRGHDVEAFRRKVGEVVKGRLVLEDLPGVIEDVGQLDEKVEKVEQDFFEEQKVKGARVYFLSHILHNWPDPLALRILARLKAAMTPGYSKLLICERILPDKGASEWEATMDMGMLFFHGGQERSREQWTKLLEEAEFEVGKFWTPDVDGQGIVEAIMKS